MKKFPGQAKNEKVLFFSRENTLYFFIKHLSERLVVIGALAFVSFVIYFIFNSVLYSILFFIITFLTYILYDNFLHHKTYVIITNKRVLKFVRSGLFSEHMKELKLDQMNEVSSVKNGFVEKIFRVGNIKIVGKDKETVIWFKGVKYPKEVAMYVSRLRDYIFVENPNYKLEDLKEFIPRKQRLEKNK